MKLILFFNTLFSKGDKNHFQKSLFFFPDTVKQINLIGIKAHCIIDSVGHFWLISMARWLEK